MQKLKTLHIVTLVILIVVFTLSAFTMQSKRKDCDDLKSYAEDAYSYFRKAYKASSLDDVQAYAKKGMRASSDAEDEADDSDCDCDDAESSASDAYSYGKKAYNSDNLPDAQSYAKKAMNSASEITDEAENCE
jgi:ABC-type transporter lipoprotein component MlaA